ncbi:MAG: alpha/beta hydrolase [Bacteroidales bacterium]|nr:alpha/beta hydrolase [Bacteroidales bacterium]
MEGTEVDCSTNTENEVELQDEKSSRLFYKTYIHSEDAPWVTLIHGVGGSSIVWFKQLRDFAKHFNVLIVDLRGHGRSRDLFAAYMGREYTFEDISMDVLDILDHLNIRKSHFVGVSLGTILIRVIAELDPDRVESMTLAGAITRLNIRSRFLVLVAKVFKPVIPFMWLYRLFARILMPRKRHKESRYIFIKEAQKIYRREINRWFKLLKDVNPLLQYQVEQNPQIPTLYLMGEEDHLFLHPVRELVKQNEMASLVTIRDSGHVCNVDQPVLFNQHAIRFIKQTAS